MAASDSIRFTFAQRIALAVIPPVVTLLVRILSLTWRYEIIAEEGVTPVVAGEKPGPMICCFWHQCVLPCNAYFRNSQGVVLISQSFDGELITRIANASGYGAVRGSSSRGSHEALIGLKQALDSGRPVIFTADGPRGPVHQSKMGPVKLAQMTGVPVFCFHTEPEHAWVMQSWDRFFIPRPFTRIVISWAKSIHVPADLPSEQLAPTRVLVTNALERARMNAVDHIRNSHT